MRPLRFAEIAHPRPPVGGLDVDCTLTHLAIVTYAIPAERLRPLVHPRFELDGIELKGKPHALLSVVPFDDVRFESAVRRSPCLRMRQTNYRVYIVDTQTGERCVWFLGTLLDSWTVRFPRHVWKLPWHPGRMHLDAELVDESTRYAHYRLTTSSRWAACEVELASAPPSSFTGFPDTETALAVLTHPMRGFYSRRDGCLGSYRIWHAPLDVHPGKVVHARFDLLARMGLVTQAEAQRPHSVLLVPRSDFTIYLPPKTLD